MKAALPALAMVLSIAAACGTVPDRNPIPAEDGEAAEIPGIPNARFWGDRRPPFYEYRLAMSEAERENLRSLGATFDLQPGRVQPLDPEDPRGRAWFVLPEFRLQYRGAGGFLWKEREREERLGSIADLTAAIADKLQPGHVATRYGSPP